MSTETINQTQLVIDNTDNVKKDQLQSKYNKFKVFGHWIIGRIAEKLNKLDEEKNQLNLYEFMMDQHCLYSSVEDQRAYYELFFEENPKFSLKDINKEVRKHNKPVKQKNLLILMLLRRNGDVRRKSLRIMFQKRNNILLILLHFKILRLRNLFFNYNLLKSMKILLLEKKYLLYKILLYKILLYKINLKKLRNLKLLMRINLKENILRKINNCLFKKNLFKKKYFKKNHFKKNYFKKNYFKKILFSKITLSFLTLFNLYKMLLKNLMMMMNSFLLNTTINIF